MTSNWYDQGIKHIQRSRSSDQGHFFDDQASWSRSQTNQQLYTRWLPLVQSWSQTKIYGMYAQTHLRFSPFNCSPSNRPWYCSTNSDNSLWLCFSFHTPVTFWLSRRQTCPCLTTPSDTPKHQPHLFQDVRVLLRTGKKESTRSTETVCRCDCLLFSRS